MPPKRKAEGEASSLPGASKKPRSNATAPSEVFHMSTRIRAKPAVPSGTVAVGEVAGPDVEAVVEEEAPVAGLPAAVAKETGGEEEGEPVGSQEETAEVEAAPQGPTTRRRGRAGGAPVKSLPKPKRGRGYWPSGDNEVAGAIWARMNALKANWKATAKAIKPVNAEIAKRTKSLLESQEDYHKNCAAYGIFKRDMQARFQMRLAKINHINDLEVEQLARLRGRQEHEIHQHYEIWFQEAKDSAYEGMEQAVAGWSGARQTISAIEAKVARDSQPPKPFYTHHTSSDRSTILAMIDQESSDRFKADVAAHLQVPEPELPNMVNEMKQRRAGKAPGFSAARAQAGKGNSYSKPGFTKWSHIVRAKNETAKAEAEKKEAEEKAEAAEQVQANLNRGQRSKRQRRH